MSKIICDVCGTSYPDTATQCPICGCVHTAAAQSVSRSTADATEAAEGYTYVKGGRFSKANVRKRNSANGVASANMISDDRVRNQKNKKNDNKGLVITAIVLFLAIIVVLLFITINLLQSGDADGEKDQGKTTNPTVQNEDDDAAVLCENISFDLDEIVFEKAGDTEKLVVLLEPDNCTEVLGEIVSEDEKVVTAELKDGVVRVLAVGPGETQIKLTCGAKTAVCKVKCDFEAEKELVLPDLVELTKKGQQKDIYPSDILRTDIEWSSDDESVATVAYGTVTAVGEGTTVIRAKYKSQIVECEVTCEFSEEADDNNDSNSGNDDVMNGTGGVTEDGGSGGGSYELKNLYSSFNDDVTLNVNDSVPFELRDSNGNRVSGVTWSSSNSDCCTVVDGTITAKAVGEATITASYGGQTYTCKIRVY